MANIENNGSSHRSTRFPDSAKLDTYGYQLDALAAAEEVKPVDAEKRAAIIDQIRKQAAQNRGLDY